MANPQKSKIDEYIMIGIAAKTIRKCPFCGWPSELASGCNYVTCYCKGGFNSKAEWCWHCQLPKYKPDPKNPGDCCNDKSHNSH